MRLRKAPKGPIAVAGILATPIFFIALMATTLAVEKPTVTEVLKQGRTVTQLGDPSGSTERTIWLLSLVPPVVLVAIGVAAMLLGRAGVLASAAAAIGMTVALLVPLDTWTDRHDARFPDGIDLIPHASTSDIYLRGEWEGTARHTAVQLGTATIVLAALAIAGFVLLEIRRRRRVAAPVPPPPPEVATTAPTPGRM